MTLERIQARSVGLPADAVFSGHTAGWLHGLDLAPGDPLEVTLPRASTISRIAGVRLTRSDYATDEACYLRGVPATSPERTAADLGRRLSLMEAVVVLDMALRNRLVDLEALARWAAAHPRYRGIGRLRSAMNRADARSESPMETRLRMLLLMDGLPEPAVQPSLHDDKGEMIGRPDLAYLSERLLIEYDGVTHRDNLAADNRRQNRLIDAGYRILRFTAGDILHRPATVTGLVRRGLAA